MTEKRTRSPGWRWLRRVLLSLLFLFIAALCGAAWVVRHMDTGWVKNRLRGVTGLNLDYADAQLRVLDGIHLGGLTVASPAKWRAVAPFLIQADGLDLGWSLFSSKGTLQKVIANDLEITIVVDEHGHSSLEGLSEGSPAAAAPTSPVTPGRQLDRLMDLIPDFGRIAFDRARLTLLRTLGGVVVERTQLTGLQIDAQSRGVEQQQHVHLVVGSHALPETLALTWHGQGDVAGEAGGEAGGKLWLDLVVDGDHAEVHGELRYDHQTLSPKWPKKATLLAVDVKARAEHDKLAVELDRFEAIDQALTSKGAIDVDPGRARVLYAHGKIDLGRLVHLLPKGLVPVELRDGHARYDVALLEVSASPSLDPRGRLELDGTLSGIRLSGSTALSLDQAKLELRGRPTPRGTGLQLNADLPAGTLHVEAAGARGNLGGVHLTAGATFQPGQPGQLEARVRFAELSGDGPPGQLAATAGEVSLDVDELELDPRDLHSLDGKVALAARLGSFDARRPEVRTHAVDVRLDAHTRVTRGEPGPIVVSLPLGAVEVASRGETVLPSGPAKLTARIDHVELDRATPARSLLDGHLDVTVGPVTLGADLHKHAEAIDFDLSLDARRTSLLTVFAPPSLALPGARMAARLTAKGRLEGSKLRAQATLHLDHPAVTLAASTMSATQLDATVSVDGTNRKQKLSFTLAPDGLTLDDSTLGSGRLVADAAWDWSRPSLEVHLDGSGDALPSGKLALSASLDPHQRVLTYALSGDLGHLGALEPLLPASLTDEHWLDLSDLRAHLQSHGTLSGLVRGVDSRGVPELAPHPLESLNGDDETELSLAQVHYVDARGVELTVPKAELSGRLHAAGERRTAELAVHLPRASLVVGTHTLDVTGLDDELRLDAVGDPRTGELDATHTLSLHRLTQSWLSAYPIAELSWTGHARRGSDGTLEVDRVVLDNPGGGTHLDLRGSLILPRTVSRRLATARSVPLVGFRSMTLSTTLRQTLDPIAGDPAHFKGRGTISIVTDAASGDLRRFHVASSVRLQKASLELPEKRLALIGLDGVVPIIEDFLVDQRGVTLVEARETNAYPAQRFSDQHPFLSGAGGLTAERITVGDLTLTHLAGNLRLERDQVALDQLEAEVRGGRIAGQCLAALRGKHATLQLRLRMTNIEAQHGGAKERFDGNAALAFAVAERTIEGRAEILRIGRHHLFDLLDEYDPHHLDPATNRVRRALALGYPDRMRVLFDRGFASYSITFGGLARLLRVEDVHGIPTGPLIDRYLGPLFAQENAP